MPSTANLTPAASILSTERVVATLANGNTVGVLSSGLPVSTAQDEAISSAVGTHAALTGAHGATAANTASRIVARDASGVSALSGVQFDTGATPTLAAGMARWDANEETLEVGVNATEAISLGAELSPRYRNTSGGMMSIGTAVYVTGATGSNTNIGLAKADALATCRQSIGIVTTDAGIANNGFGRVCTYGVSHNHDTSAYTAGDMLWVSPTVAGGLTNVEPTTEGYFKVKIGTVQRAHATLGEIFVDPEFFGSVTGDAVASAVSKQAARDAIDVGTFSVSETSGGTVPAPLATVYLVSGYTALRSDVPLTAGTLDIVSVYVKSASAGVLCVVSLNGSNQATLVAAREVSLVAGWNNIEWAITTTAGHVLGCYVATDGVAYSTGGTGRYLLGVPGATAASTTSFTNTFSLSWRMKGGVVQRLGALDFDVVTGGSYPAAGPGGGGQYLGSGNTAIRSTIIADDAVLTEVSANMGSAGAAFVYLLEVNRLNQITLVAAKSFTSVVGLQTIPWTQSVKVGQRIGIYTAAGLGASYFAGTSALYCAGVPGTLTAGTTFTNTDFGIGWSYDCALGRRVFALEGLSEAAISLGATQLLAADDTGSTDSTAAFAAAIVAHPYPYVRPGTFSLTSIPRRGAGFWGPGYVDVGTVRLPISSAPRDGALVDALRSSMSGLAASGSPHVLIGDSLSAHFTATALSKHWFNRLEDALNLYEAPGTEPSTVVVRNDDGTTGETAAFYGITVSGGSNGTRGPVGKSVILAAGGYIEFTGAYAQVDVFYQQEAGAGELLFTFNGGATYKTVDADGATSLDKFSGPSATGQAASGTYRITASSAAVEITGLVRHAALIATAGTPPPIWHMRAAYGGYTGTSFSDTRVDAIIAQALGLAGGTLPEYTLALLTNDALFGSAPRPDTYEANLNRIIDKLQTGGTSRINFIVPSRPLYSSWGSYYTSPQTFETFVAIALKVCGEQGVNVLRLDQVDFYSAGLMHTDNLHWNDAGNQKVFEMFCRWRADL